MLKRTVLALAIAALTLSVAAQAQQHATLLLRSGDRVSGDLVDMGGAGFTIRVNGQERQIATNDVAVIDFGGGDISDTDWGKVNAGSHLVWLKSGQTVSGQLYDISGTTPLKIIFKTESGDREFSANDIGRIALARPSSAVATSGANLASATGGGVSVSPKQAWTPTGRTVRRGDILMFNATGEVQLSGDAGDVATPYGSKSGRKAANAPLPDVLAGALIGKVGANGQPFPIGTGQPVTMPAAGQLFLGVNDDGFGDNQGEFRVDITVQSRRR